ncbi:MAG: 30S ribosomal protein S4e [Halobacteria archaeon]
MMVHQKRISAPDTWPIERKHQVYTVGSQAGPHDSGAVPLVVFVRDILGYCEDAKEVRYVLENDGIFLNGEPVSDHQRQIGTFDILSFPARDEFYRVFPGEGGRLALTPVEEDAATDKLAKIDDVTEVPGGDTQLNLHNGYNLLVEDDGYSTGDSVVVDLDESEIVDHFPYTEGCAVTAVKGRHSGEVGELLDVLVNEGSSPNTVSVELTDGTVFETVEDYVFVIGESITSLEEQEEAEAEDVSELKEEHDDELETAEEADDHGEGDG